MKLSQIKYENIIQAGESIDFGGIPLNYLYNNYWVKLPNGREYPFKHIVRIAYKIASENEDSELNFQSNFSYREYIKELGFQLIYYKEDISFFGETELSHFQKIAGTPYRKINDDHVRAGEVLVPLVRKLNVWAERSRVEDFMVKKDNSWQWSGTFKSYLWLRIYRNNDSRNVYFVLGINNQGGLYLELNCQRSNHTGGSTQALPKHKIELFDEHLESVDYSDKVIEKSTLEKYDWDRLIEETKLFIYKYAALYDELESIANEMREEQNTEEFVLTESSPPDRVDSYVDRERFFEGVKTDWSKKQAVSMSLGDAGERLVIRMEKQKLLDAGLSEKADLVEKKLDGEGYDILSFDEVGNEIHIEVKTTTYSLHEPFYMSVNEKAYLKKFPDNYFLYRLFQYRFNNKSAKFYKMSGEMLNKLVFKATNFEVSILNEPEK